MYKLNDFENDIKRNTMIVLGNGFSVNFDSGYSDIYSRLFITNKTIIPKINFESDFNNENFNIKLKTNYKECIKFFKNLNEDSFNKVFEDGVNFAEYILENKEIMDKLEEKRYISQLSFGLSEFDILENIVKYGKEDYKYVNIENWTILIYFYYAIGSINLPLDKSNKFINALKAGDKDKRQFIVGDANMYSLYHNVLFNGFYNYYRALMLATIFNNGKVNSIDRCNRIDEINFESVFNFLKMFKYIATMNYDNIIENIGMQNIVHMHGQYKTNKGVKVFNQRLSLVYENEEYELSDMIVGEYFTSKVMAKITSKLTNKYQYNPPTFDDIIVEKEIDKVVVFGMNIENDYHVVREIVLGFFDRKVKNPKIVYCYYNDHEKTQFEEVFNRILTFSKEVNKYGDEIKICYVDTKEILRKHFY